LRLGSTRFTTFAASACINSGSAQLGPYSAQFTRLRLRLTGLLPLHNSACDTRITFLNYVHVYPFMGQSRPHGVTAGRPKLSSRFVVL